MSNTPKTQPCTPPSITVGTSWIQWSPTMRSTSAPGGLISGDPQNGANLIVRILPLASPAPSGPVALEAGDYQITPSQSAIGSGLGPNALAVQIWIGALESAQIAYLSDVIQDCPPGIMFVGGNAATLVQPLPTNYGGSVPHTIQGKVAIAGTPNQLTAPPNYILQTGLTLKASQNNGATGMTVGFTNALTDVADGTGNGAIVYPGEPLWIPPGVNLNSIWINSATALDIVYGLGS